MKKITIKLTENLIKIHLKTLQILIENFTRIHEKARLKNMKKFYYNSLETLTINYKKISLKFIKKM